jgi:hypothetical protein
MVKKLGFTVRRKVDWPQQGFVDLYVLTRETYEKKAANRVHPIAETASSEYRRR